jgi:hypothetical protein
MPRIAAALGVLATVAYCIGFNIQRYPVVWQSLAAVSNPPAGTFQPTTGLQPRGAIASTIRPAPLPTGLPRPIPLPQVAAQPRPIPAAIATEPFPDDNPAKDYEPAPPVAAKYAGAGEPANPVASAKSTAATAKTVTDPKKPGAVASDKKKANMGAAPKAAVSDKKNPSAGANPKATASNKKAKPPEATVKVASSDKKPPAPAKSTKTAAASDKRPGPNQPQPISATPSETAATTSTATKNVATPTGVPADHVAPITRVVERPMVPIPQGNSVTTADPRPGWNTSRSSYATTATANRLLRRLPATDPSQASLANPFAPAPGALPFYPTTGM